MNPILEIGAGKDLMNRGDLKKPLLAILKERVSF